MLGFLPKDWDLAKKVGAVFVMKNEIGIARLWSFLMAPLSIFCVLPFKYQDSFAPVNFPSSFKKTSKSEKRKGKLVFEQGIFEASGFENCYDLKDKPDLVFISLCSVQKVLESGKQQFNLGWQHIFCRKLFFRTPLLD